MGVEMLVRLADLGFGGVLRRTRVRIPTAAVVAASLTALGLSAILSDGLLVAVIVCWALVAALFEESSKWVWLGVASVRSFDLWLVLLLAMSSPGDAAAAFAFVCGSAMRVYIDLTAWRTIGGASFMRVGSTVAGGVGPRAVVIGIGLATGSLGAVLVAIAILQMCVAAVSTSIGWRRLQHVGNSAQEGS